ncbi:MAG: ribosome maturation factor RimM [Actinomycetota bacterium]|nr:ribosome maturation factor RimM [Actinomycetota bacterium]
MSGGTSTSRKLVIVGKVLKPHGVGGALLVHVESDAPQRFEPGSELVVGDASGEARKELVVERASPYKGRFLVRFRGIDGRKLAEELAGKFLMAYSDTSPELPEGNYWAFQLVGLRFLDEERGEVGVVEDVIKGSQQDLILVRLPDGSEAMIPMVREFIKKIDLKNQLMVGKLIEGMVSPK